MKHINLGNTGLSVSRLCLGMMTYGSKKWHEWVGEEAAISFFAEYHGKSELDESSV